MAVIVSGVRRSCGGVFEMLAESSQEAAPWQGGLQETIGAFQVKVRKARAGRGWEHQGEQLAVRITEWLWKSLDMTGEGATGLNSREDTGG